MRPTSARKFWLLSTLIILAASSVPSSGQIPPGYDKLGHMAEYFIWAFFMRLSYKRRRSRGFGVILAAFVLALLDEYYQSFIPTRQSDLFDIMADVAGATLSQLLLEWRYPVKGSYIYKVTTSEKDENA